MKKSYIFMPLCLIFALSCRDSSNIEWYNADTLRITAGGGVGESDPGESVVIRTEKACRAATLNAMALAAVTLGEVDRNSVSDFQQEGVRFSAFIRGGSVLSRTFAPASNECTVVYELKEKGLKEKAKRASLHK